MSATLATGTGEKLRRKLRSVLAWIFKIALATVITTILNLLLFADRRRLRAYTNPARTVVVRANQLDQLQVNFETRPIEKDITTAQVAIWNQGNQAIKKDNILLPLTISTENSAPILAATIQKRSRPVIGLLLNTENIEKGNLSVSWDILERGDGGVVELTYVGDPHLTLFVQGTIEGQGQIEQLTFTRYASITFYKIVLIYACFALPLATLIMIQFLEAKGVNVVKKSVITLVIVTGLAAALLLGLFFMAAEPHPPFGF